MRSLSPLLGFVFLATFVTPATADWVKHGQLGTVATFYYDPTTVKKRGQFVRVWVYTELAHTFKNVESQGDGERSSRAEYEIDCTKHKRRTLRRMSFSGPMMSGEVVFESAAGKWTTWNDAPDSTLIPLVCK